MFLPHPRVKVSIVGSLRDREVACSASDRQGSNFESCVWRTVSSQSSHHPQEVLLAQFSLYVHKGGLKPDSFPFSHSSRTEYLGPFANNGSLPTRGVGRLPGPLSDQLWRSLKNAETPPMVLIGGEFPLTWFLTTALLSKQETKVSSVYTRTDDTAEGVYAIT